MTDSITYGSFCTGYDGIGLGLQLAGLRLDHRWMAETEPAVGRVLKREHDGVPNVGDLKTAPWQMAPKVRLVSSGDPCQSISVAGRQAGRDDPRFLWPWVRAGYCAIMPAFLFFENVANIVSHDKGRTMAERFEHLREDGYAVRWTVLGACAVGAPHHRHRWYALAAHVGPGAPKAVRVGGGKAICGAPRSGGRALLPSPMARDSDGRGEGDSTYRQGRGRTNGMPLGAAVSLLPTPRTTDTNGAGRTEALEGGDDLRTAVSLLPTPRQRDYKGHEHGDRTARGMHAGDDLPTAIKQLLPTPRASDGENGRGNPGQVYGSGTLPLAGAVAKMLPTPTHADGERGSLTMVRGNPTLKGAALGLLPTPTTSNMHGNHENGRGELLLPGIVARPEAWGRYAEAVALWEAITGVPAPAPTEPGKNGAPRLTAALPEWMMGLRPGLLTDELSRPEALKAGGNGCVPLAVAAAYRLLSAG
jgi:DNA (cytosine-5)-methyltransferase 1